MIKKIFEGGGTWVICICRDTGMCHYLVYLLFPLGFFGISSECFRIFGIIFLVKFIWLGSAVESPRCLGTDLDV